MLNAFVVSELLQDFVAYGLALRFCAFSIEMVRSGVDLRRDAGDEMSAGRWKNVANRKIDSYAGVAPGLDKNTLALHCEACKGSRLAYGSDVWVVCRVCAVVEGFRWSVVGGHGLRLVNVP